MFCPNCGANLPDGTKFCPQCGAVAAPAQPAPPTGGEQAPTPGPAAYPGAAAPTGAPGAYPPPPPQAPAANNPYPYGGQAAPADNAAPPKKSNTLRNVLIALAVVAAVIVLLVVVFKAIGKDPVDNEPTTATIAETTQEATTAADGQTTTMADGQTTTEAAQTTAAPETTVPPETAAPDDSFTDAEVKELLGKMEGYWNSDDDTVVLSITREDDGRYMFSLGYWYSEVVMAGYLQQPVKGDPDGVVSVWMFYEGEEGIEGPSMPPQNGAERFDLSDLSSGILRWQNDGNWYEYHYAGATMEEAAPPM